MATELIDHQIEFACIPWRTRMTDQGLQIQPERGTWTLMPSEHPMAKDAKGILSCPNCARMYVLLPDMGEPSTNPKDRTLSSIRCNCGLIARAILRDWNKRILYCAAFETRDSDGNLTPNKEYMHAESEQDAKTQFWASHPPSNPPSNFWINLIGIAPVVGYFALDKQEKKLTV